MADKTIRLNKEKGGYANVITMTEGDSNVFTAEYRVDRYWGDTDLSTLTWHANVKAANGEVGYYTLTLVRTDADAITLRWKIGSGAVPLRGETLYTIEGKTSASNPPVWKSGLQKIVVNPAISAESVMANLPQDEMEQLATELREEMAEISDQVDAMPAKMETLYMPKWTGPNLFDLRNKENLPLHRFDSSGGVIETTELLGISHYINIEEGVTYLVYNGGRTESLMRTVIYDEDGDIISILDSPKSAAFVAPEGADTMRFVYVLNMVGICAEEYSPMYGNLFNAYSGQNIDLKYMTWSSGVVNNSADDWGTSHYIPVSSSTVYTYISGGTNTAPQVIAYDANLTALGALSTTDVGTKGHKKFTTTATTAWIRIPYAIGKRYGVTHLVRGQTVVQFDTYHGRMEGLGDPVDAYLPDDVYCAVGTTLDIYTNQVCLDPEWYTCRWICDVGYPLERKFTVTGTTETIGNHALTFQVIDKYGNMVYNKTATLRIVSNTIAAATKIMIIGDSLTRANKPVLAELVRLSNGMLVPVGTITETAMDSNGLVRTLKCEARSGWSPLEYHRSMGDTNPFYDSGFSWSKYITDHPTEEPDIVAIFLGTNGMSENADTQSTRIKNIVQNIRTTDANIPIMVVNTLFKSNQDGIGKESGSDGYTSGTVGPVKRFEDKKVMDLAKMVNLAVANIEDVMVVDVAIHVDGDYSFGMIEEAVSPHNVDYTEFVPKESVHPQPSGYYQIADALFGAYCSAING